MVYEWPSKVTWKHELKGSFHCPKILSSQKIKSFSELKCFILSKRFLGQPLAYLIRNFDWSSFYNPSLLREISSSLLLISEKGLRDRGSLVVKQSEHKGRVVLVWFRLCQRSFTKRVENLKWVAWGQDVGTGSGRTSINQVCIPLFKLLLFISIYLLL